MRLHAAPLGGELTRGIYSPVNSASFLKLPVFISGQMRVSLAARYVVGYKNSVQHSSRFSVSYSQYGLTFLKFTTWVENDNGDRYRQISYDPATTYGFGGGFFLYTANYGGFFVESNYYMINSKNAEAEYEGDTYFFGENVSAWDIRGGIRILIGSGE